MSNNAVKCLLTQKFPVKFWLSLLPRTIYFTIPEIEELIISLDSSSKRLGKFITPKKKLKADFSMSNLTFYFTIDVFQSSKSGSSDEL